MRETPTESDAVRTPPLRIRAANERPLRRGGDYVLYWMIANRRTVWNFALQRAVECCRELQRPLLIFEPLRCDYRWHSVRMHAFVIAGMRDNALRCAAQGVTYFPYVEPAPRAGAGLLAALAERACLVVSDDDPAFFLPRMLAHAAGALNVRLECVDSNGLLPLRAADRIFPTAYAFRRFLQHTLPQHIPAAPQAEPLSGAGLAAAPLDARILKRWPAAESDLLACEPAALRALPVEQAVPVAAIRGGHAAARAALLHFLDHNLRHYADERNQPEREVASGLSPYLHFGHISTHEIFAELASRERWRSAQLSPSGVGKRAGWWKMSPPAEAFLDELITWRELGYNMAWQCDTHDRYETLPAWAQQTLAKHARDPRPSLYSLEQFERARTHDPLWNAAQTQLLREGRMHNYLRMLWGKKILEWSRSAEDALQIMIELNNKYALDGRDPNSYSGICWVLGRYDRPWGPERPIFGTIRYMSSENTARKVSVKGYIERYSDTPRLFD